MWNKAKTKEVLGIDDRLFMLIGIPFVAFIFPLLFIESGNIRTPEAFLAKFVISLFYTSLYWVSIRAACIYFRRRFPSYRDTRKRLFYYFIAIVILYSIIEWGCNDIHRLFKGTIVQKELENNHFVLMPFVMIILVSTIYESIFLFYRWKESVLEAEKLRRENIQSQLEGLKNQVNPHFLFNSLNTLAYLIPEDQDKAVCFVQKLSKVYRYILEIRDKKLITLIEELEFLQSYIFLLRERFGENIDITINIDERFKEYYIVPLSLQILFENAIKHNIISKEKPLSISVFTTANTLMVSNNLQKKVLTAPSTQVGLKNIRNRYAYFVDKEVSIFEDDHHFKVSLPLIKPSKENKKVVTLAV